VRGDLKDSYILRSLNIEENGNMNENEEDYYLIKLETVQKPEENDPPIQDLYFLSEEERTKFLNIIDKLNESEEEDDEAGTGKIISGEHSKEEILEIKPEADLKNEELSKKGNDESNINAKLDSQESTKNIVNDGVQNLNLIRAESIEESKTTMLSNLSLRRGKSEIKNETEIRKTLREKHQLQLERHEYPVKIHGTFGLKHKRVLRINNDFEFMLFKKEKVAESDVEAYNYKSHMQMYDILKIKPRDGDNSRVEFIFRDEVSFFIRKKGLI